MKKKFQKIKISNEKSFNSFFKSQKNKDKQLYKKENNDCPLIILIFALFIGILIILFLIYLLKKQLYPNYIINNNAISNNNYNTVIESYIKAQKDFCENPDKYKNQKYDDDIYLIDVKFNELKYQIYIYKSSNFILGEYKNTGAFEIPLGNNMIEALNFYSKKNNIFNNKDIYMLDIGGNVGWYPSLLGRYGYTILSFEAFERNYYVSKKNYCLLNRNSNVITITKGLGLEEKDCIYYNHRNNEGNGMVICDNTNTNNRGDFIKVSTVSMTTLNTFIPYLSDKKVALMKLDVEGHELKILEGGKELITKYHVPFVVLEFSPTFLKMVGSEPRSLAQFFDDNGYKISIKGFLSKEYITVDELLQKAGFQVNTYFIHKDMANLIY